MNPTRAVPGDAARVVSLIVSNIVSPVVTNGFGIGLGNQTFEAFERITDDGDTRVTDDDSTRGG